jgi:hypothetical protein
LSGIVKAIVIRVSETNRINKKDVQRLNKRASVLTRDLKIAEVGGEHSAVQEIQGKLVQGDLDRLQCVAAAEEAAKVLEWLCGELFNNIYPGTVFEREVTALELLHCSLDALGDSSLLKGIFFHESMTKTMLNLLLSSWDKSRKLAADLLLRFPRPLPCFTTSSEVEPLINRGCKLGTPLSGIILHMEVSHSSQSY